ncbi:MAG: hypothetical protein JWN08_673, partial [Frankiales bacterium]|nr:hypothetical protein [Frankiales bacterium]
MTLRRGAAFRRPVVPSGLRVATPDPVE